MPDAVEELLDVQIDHPAAPQAAVPAHPRRVQGRPARPVPIGIPVENRLHADPQMPGHDRLGNPVSDSRDAEHPGPAAMLFRYLHRTHRRGEVGPRGHPVPDPEQVVLQIGLEVRDGPPIHPRSTLIRLHLPEGLPDLPLRNLKRLALRLQLAHAVPPRPTARLTGRTQPRMTLPLGSAPITEASQLLRAGPPARLATVLSPSRFQPPGRLPLTTLTRAAVSSRAFSRSTRTQQTRLTSPLRRTPPGQSAGTRQAHPGTI